MNNRPIIVIGAGICGLTLTLALLRQKINVLLFDKEKEIEQRGAGINISPNGTSILYNLGLKEEINKLACKPNNIELKNFNNGFLIANQNLNNSCEKKFNYPFFQAQRKDVITSLTHEINNLSPDTIFFDHEFENYKENNNYVRVEFSNQKTVDGSIIVGCDGINSKVRKKLNPDSKNEFSKIIAWRGLFKIDGLSEKIKKLPPTIWVGKNKHFVHYPVNRNKLLNFIGTVKKNEWTDDSWYQTGNKNDLISDFGLKNKVIKEIIESTENPNKWGLFNIKNVKNWISNRAIIIGDAAHSMSPSYGQGSNSAMEDAIILSRLIAKNINHKNIFLKYEKNRKKRIYSLSKASHRNLKFFHTSNNFFKFFMHLGLYILSKIIPIILIQSKWIYKYDAFKMKIK